MLCGIARRSFVCFYFCSNVPSVVGVGGKELEGISPWCYNMRPFLSVNFFNE